MTCFRNPIEVFFIFGEENKSVAVNVDFHGNGISGETKNSTFLKPYWLLCEEP